MLDRLLHPFKSVPETRLISGGIGSETWEPRAIISHGKVASGGAFSYSLAPPGTADRQKDI